MRMKVTFLIAALSLSAAADERVDYYTRAANADMAAFRQLDLNGDGRLTQEEAKADLNLGPRFNDIDINRDGVITHDELLRYIRQTYSVSPPG